MHPTGRPLLFLILAPLVSTVAPLSAQETIEIKYLAPDAASVARIKSTLGLADSSTGDPMEIYFFDTPSLTLLKDQHLALRLRRKGQTWTFTLKERPTTRQPAEIGLNGWIETDECIGTLEKTHSFCIDSNPSNASIKAALEKDSIEGLLSLAQQDFLKKRRYQIPWAQMRRLPRIEARRWTLPDFENLTAESWQYPGGEVLEISYKAKPKNPTTAEKKFATWLTAHSINPEQGSGLKTATVLETITKQLPPK